MYLKKIKAQNFRLLKDISLDARKSLSLIIGKNNSGKTSFIVLFDKFFKNGTEFSFDDFSLDLREKILNINDDTNEHELSIRLILEIDYSNAKTLENISNFFLDLESEENEVKILFECCIKKNELIKEIESITDKDPTKQKEKRERFIKKDISRFFKKGIYSFVGEKDILKERTKLVEKDWGDVNKLINYRVIHAKRDLYSSESSGASQGISSVASTYFKTKNKLSHADKDIINSALLDMDSLLEKTYEDFFKGFLNSSNEFLPDIENLKVSSNLESKEILSHHSKVIYGDNDNHLPEHFNGLGYLNILYLLLQVKIKQEYFKEQGKDINIFFIEEPEAHTHPQMQSIFIKKIKNLLGDDVQAFITTHSSYIVKDSNFEDIRYFSKKDSRIQIKNFYDELKEKYGEKEKKLFQFLEQYLTINSSELFFADKIIFIEGVSERLLLPYFMKKIDIEEKNKDENWKKLTSQNISVLEVGANAKAFRYFIEFFEIKTLIITDIDTVKAEEITDKNEKKRIVYKKSIVQDSTHTSNETLKYFLDGEQLKDTNLSNWMKKLKKGKFENTDLLKISYQLENNEYHGRSFEEDFMSLNLEKIKENKGNLLGIKNIDDLDKGIDDNFTIDDLTDSILEKKSDFASSLLYLGLTDQTDWEIPDYILNGLLWIQKD